MHAGLETTLRQRSGHSLCNIKDLRYVVSSPLGEAQNKRRQRTFNSGHYYTQQRGVCCRRDAVQESNVRSITERVEMKRNDSTGCRFRAP